MRFDVDRQNEVQTTAEALWLLGQPHLADYLDFVREAAVGGSRISPRVLTDEWRVANDRYYDLEQQEAGIADTLGCEPLDPALTPLAEALLATDFVRNTFNSLPLSVEMVELDKLIVSQTHVMVSFCEQRARLLGARPTPEQLFQYCQPLERSAPPVRIEKTDRGTWLVSSPSSDLRPHEELTLAADVVASLPTTGPVAAGLALLVGFGSNCLTAIRSGRRMVLHNGYHRAYTLRSLGITHAPCLIETVSRKDELRIAATDKVSEDPEFYFAAARPPILKDFFDPALARRWPLRPRRTVVEVEFTMRKSTFIEPDAG